MTNLGDLELSAHLILNGLESGSRVAGSTRRTLGGQSVHQYTPLSGGRSLELVGNNAFTLAQINQIKDLEGEAQEVVLVHHRGTFTVFVTGVDPEPAFEFANPDDDEMYSATIYLQEL